MTYALYYKPSEAIQCFLWKKNKKNKKKIIKKNKKKNKYKKILKKNNKIKYHSKVWGWSLFYLL